MKKKALIALLVLIIGVGAVAIFTAAERSKARRALADYKAALRAQGEKLTFEEAGYPFPLETNANLENFVLLTDQLRSKSSIPGSFDLMPYESPGRAVVSWAGDQLKPAQPNSRNAPAPSWDDLSSDMKTAQHLLAELRAELEHPPRYFGWDYKNPLNLTPRNPYVQKRAVAQFLAADCLCALRERELPRAQADLHGLTQLAQVHRGDLTLVSAMVRVAISGLGLAATWEALSAEGWDEAALQSLQRDWEAIDLAAALETGLVGERLFGEQAFQVVRQTNSAAREQIFSFRTGKGGFAGFRDRMQTRAAVMFWQGHAEQDELFYLRHSQTRVENARRIRANASGAAIKREMESQFKQMEQTFDAPLGKYRHLFSAIAIPNYLRAFDSAVRSETQRRMTVTAIALKRFHLRNGRYPESLSELVPQLLGAEFMDPWSGKPFHYRLNPDGTFTLYSVGEDGKDDGGDATPAKPGVKLDLWAGKDAVWPAPVYPDSATKD